MPRLDFIRDDLRIGIDAAGLRIECRGKSDLSGPVSTPRQLAARLEASQAAAAWQSGAQPGPLRRVTLEIREPALSALTWETAVTLPAGEAAVLRVSPVRPRCANFPFSLPLRMLEVNPDTEGVIEAAAKSLVSDRPPGSYAAALRVANTHWFSWKTAAVPEDWPNVDVLHIHSLPLPGNAMSADPAVPGSLGWFAEMAVAWQVRLVVLHAPARDGDQLREFGTRLCARGGPAVIVSAPEGRKGIPFDRFYSRLIHDDPLDAIWKDLPLPASGASLFAGAGREDQLRVSNVAVALLEFGDRENAPARRRIVLDLHAGNASPKERTLLTRSFERTLGSVKQHWGSYKFAFHELGGLLPLADAVTNLRTGLSGPVSAENVLLSIPSGLGTPRGFRKTPTIGKGATRGPRRKPPAAASKKSAARFVNATFWWEGEGGDLRLVDQKKGRFDSDRLYHLGIQIGPRDVRVVTAHAAAIIEEVFKWRPEMKGLWVELGVTGIDFEVVGDPVQRVWLPQSAPSEMVYFAVIPRRTGVCRLRFALYFEQNVVQSFRLAAIAGVPPPNRAEALSSALGIGKASSLDAAYLPVVEFALVPSVNRLDADISRLPRRALSIIANDWHDQPVISVKSASDFSVTLPARLPGEVKDLQRVMREISGTESRYPFGVDNSGNAEIFQSALRRLADQGRMLYNELFDAADWKSLSSVLDEPGQVIQVAQILREKVIPWSFVYQRALKPRAGDRDANGTLTGMPVCTAGLPDEHGNLPADPCGKIAKCLVYGHPAQACKDQNGLPLKPENVVCPLQFWGFKHVVELPPQQVEPAVKPAARSEGVFTQIAVVGKARMVAGVNATFSGESDHFSAIQELAARVPLSKLAKEYRASTLMEQLAKSPLHIAYFFCHAGKTPDGASCIVLQGPQSKQPDVIVWSEFGDILNGESKWTPPALVFLNGCQTANYSPDALSPFLHSFVDQLGASGLIGTEITVWDTLAAEMGLNFLRAFLDCEAAGPALLRARRMLLAKGNPLGLVYTLHGSAALVLTPSVPIA